MRLIAPPSSHPHSIGRNIKQLIDRQDEPYCFRLHRERVYYVSERLVRQATSVARDDLIALGVCFGKFTKTKKFHLKITALDFLTQHAKVCVCACVCTGRAGQRAPCTMLERWALASLC